jgi:lysozyme family protein
MADMNIYFPKMQKWEGGFVNHPNDPGGATKGGVTIGTWRQMGYDKDGDGDIDANDIKLLSEADIKSVLKKGYWDRWQADKIKNQSVAESLVEWVWGSGKWGVIIPQRLLGLKQDGIVGPATIAAVNKVDSKLFFYELQKAKFTYINEIIKSNPKLGVFRQGWFNRINDFKYELP